jgi:hypothetical protein
MRTYMFLMLRKRDTGLLNSREKNISKPRVIICKAPPLSSFSFFSLLKKTSPSLGAVIICNATSLCLLAVHMPTVVEIIVPPLPVPAQPVVCLCKNKK